MIAYNFPYKKCSVLHDMPSMMTCTGPINGLCDLRTKPGFSMAGLPKQHKQPVWNAPHFSYLHNGPPITIVP